MIKLDGKFVKIEYIIPDEIKAFFIKNGMDEKRILKDYKWEQCIYEDLLDENHNVKNDFESATLVINYIHINQENHIRVSLKDFAKRKCVGSGNWVKGTFFREFSIGYSIFTD